MADREINAKIKATDEASANLDKISTGMKAALIAVPIAATAALAALAIGFTKALGDMTEVAGIQHEADIQLGVALKNLGKNVSEDLPKYKAYAGELQRISRSGDEVIQGTQAILASLGGLTDHMNDRATKATLDFAAAMKFDLTSASTLMAKAAGGNVSALSRYGIMVDSRIPKDKQFAEVLRQIEEKFGGVSEALAGTFPGRLEQIENSFGDVQEKVVAGAVENEALSISLGFVSDSLQGLGGWLDENKDSMDVWTTGGVKIMVSASIILTDVIADMSFAFETFGTLINKLTGSNKLLGLALAVVVAEISKLKTMADLLTGSAEKVEEKLGGVVDINHEFSDGVKELNSKLLGLQAELDALVPGSEKFKQKQIEVNNTIDEQNKFLEKLTKKSDEFNLKINEMLFSAEALSEQGGAAFSFFTDEVTKMFDALQKIDPERAALFASQIAGATGGKITLELDIDPQIAKNQQTVIDAVLEAGEVKIAAEEEINTRLEEIGLSQEERKLLQLERELEAFRLAKADETQILEFEAARRLEIAAETEAQQTTLREQTLGIFQTGFQDFLAGAAEGSVQLADLQNQIFGQMQKAFASWIVKKASLQLKEFLFTKTIKAKEKGTTLLSDIPQVFSGAYKAIVGIPFVGPFLAPVIAAAAVGAVLKFAGGFEQGGEIPFLSGVSSIRDSVLLAGKPGERVLDTETNAAFKEQVREGGVGGGETTVNIITQVSGVTREYIEEVIRVQNDLAIRFGLRVVATEIAT